MPTTGTLSSLCVNLSTAPGTGSQRWTWTLFKNGVGRISIGDDFRCADAGMRSGQHRRFRSRCDLVSLHVTPSSSPALAPTHALAGMLCKRLPYLARLSLFGSQDFADAGCGFLYLSLAGNSSSRTRGSCAMATIILDRGNSYQIHLRICGNPETSATATLDSERVSWATLLRDDLRHREHSSPSRGISAFSPPGDVLDVFMTGFSSTTGCLRQRGICHPVWLGNL